MTSVVRIGAACVVAVAGVACGQVESNEAVGVYEGCQVVAVELNSVADVRAMQAIGADQWSHRVREGEPTDFMVTPEQLTALDGLGLPYVVRIADVQAQVDAERARLRDGGVARAWFDDFKDLDAINTQLDAFAASRPDIAETFDVGLTLEGRTMRGLRIANNAFGDGTCKPTILINACQHAREWIAPMVGMYTADQLLAQHGVDPDITALVDRAEILIIPVANPDGYSFTWTSQRLWRKNRRNNGNGSIGVDLNRNWGVGWGLSNGSSGSGFSETYRGAAPFSEPETQVIKALAEAQPRLAAQVDLHSYGQLILAPWGYTVDLPPDHTTFQSLGAQMQQIIQSVNGRTYTHGPCYTALYPISGGEGDWFWGDREAHNFLFELRGNSFILPPEQIIPNCEEIYPALVYFMSWARTERKPAADFNDDAAINTLDVLAFLNVWIAGGSEADFNGDGSVNSQDVLAFLNEWIAGC